MIALSDQNYLSPEEFLVWEVQQSQRYEYLDGQAYAMSGGTLPHNAIAINLVAVLRNHMRQKNCRLYGSDARVFVSEKGPFFYPDLVVTCDSRDFDAIQGLRHPCLIIEVLSPSTQSFDYSEKFRQYRRLESLQEYILIASDRPAIDCYFHRESKRWDFESYSPQENQIDGIEFDQDPMDLSKIIVPFKSLDFSCSLATVYEDVVFAASAKQAEN
ncbi:MAG: Uma2 family endonuclease (plasmid) [Limnothrix sp. BL-A-16]